MNIKEQLLDELIKILKRRDVKDEIKNLLKPSIDDILKEIYPYIVISILFVFISFLLILGIFILLLRNKSFFTKFSKHTI